MQRFSSLLLIIAATFAALFSTHCVDAQNANVTITSITKLTAASNDLRVTTSRIEASNVLENGFSVGTGLVSISNSVQQLATSISVPNPQPFDDDTEGQVLALLTTFVQAHEALLSIIIGKHDLLAQSGFVQPVRLALVGLQSAVDSFVVALTALIPAHASAGRGAKAGLDRSLQAAITTYES